jgi:sugar lactone lactonase YvrE
MTEAVACTTEQDELGEGVRWDARHDELLRVDILRGRVHRDRVDSNGGLVPVRTYEVGGLVGAVTPIDGDDGWLLARDRGFAHLALDGSVRQIAEVAPPGVRMNDAACDPQGRFWAGTMSSEPGGATLYRLDRHGAVEPMLDDLTVSNGLGWSPDGRTMYHADSGPRLVRAFDFDAERGTISHPRVLLDLDDADGAPDGLTVDVIGDLWIAIWGAGQVRRYAPDGTLHEVLEVPTPETTCCAFGGPELRRLYVTTATEHWTDERRRAEPGAGLVYRFDTAVSGPPAEPFRPDPAWWSTVVGPERRGRSAPA